MKKSLKKVVLGGIGFVLMAFPWGASAQADTFGLFGIGYPDYNGQANFGLSQGQGPSNNNHGGVSFGDLLAGSNLGLPNGTNHSNGNFGLGWLPDCGPCFFDFDGCDGKDNNGVPPVPEPATLLLVGAGLVGMLKFRSKRAA